MGSLHRQVAVKVPHEKLFVFIFDAQFFSKQKETSFIWDQYCHLVDDGSPLSWSVIWTIVILTKYSEAQVPKAPNQFIASDKT